MNETLKYSLVGSPETINDQLRALIEQTQPDELIFGSHIFDHAARLHSFELLAQVYDEVANSFRNEAMSR